MQISSRSVYPHKQIHQSKRAVWLLGVDLWVLESEQALAFRLAQPHTVKCGETGKTAQRNVSSAGNPSVQSRKCS
jgi:hypothetical protein